MRNRKNKAKTNRRGGTESRGFKVANFGDNKEPETVIADRRNALLSHQHRRVAPSQMATSANAKPIGTRDQSSPPSSSRPLKVKGTDSKLETGPSFSAAARHTFGTSDGDLMAEILLQVTRALPNAEPLDPHGNHALAALHGIGPQDTVEGLLSAQMVVGHNLAMEFLQRAALKAQPLQGVELYVNLATKLQRTFIAQVEALDRHRGRGQQNMNVEHVHVHDGAHAIVGPVSHQESEGATQEDHGQPN